MLMKGYQVEWCEDWPDQADVPPLKVREFAAEKPARTFARRVAKGSFFGTAMIYPFHREPYERGYPGLRKELDLNHGEEIE